MRRKVLSNKKFNKSLFIKLFTCLGLAYTISLTPVYSQQIVPDGYTNTSLNINGKVTNVSTSTIKNQNAFNSFSRFNVDAGNTVNLVVPGNAQNLINIVKNEVTNINGVLNSLKNGVVGGNVYLVNPYGVVVGNQGILNVGSLTAVTPTKQFTDNFFDSPGNPNDQAVSALLNGTAPINDQATVNVAGKISAINSVNINAGNITNKGVIEIADIVNLDGLSNAGTIRLVASKNIEMASGSVVDASAQTANGNGGSIYIFGNDQVNFNKGAVVDISGGKVSGNGGAVEISSDNNVILGGSFKSEVVNGKLGEILVDPPTLDITTNQFSVGANMTFQADNRITVHNGVVVSSRNVANPENVDHTSAPSIGNSGNISFDVGLAGNTGVMNFDSNCVVASFGDNGFTSGMINITSNNINIAPVPGVMTFYPGNELISFSRHTAGDVIIEAPKGGPDDTLRMMPSELQTVYLGTTVVGNSANTNNLTANVTINSDPAMQYPLIFSGNTSVTLNGGIGINMNGSDVTLMGQTVNLNPGANITANNAALVFNNLNFDLTSAWTQITTAVAEGVIYLSRYSAGNLSLPAGSGQIANRLNGNVTIGNSAFTNQYTNDVLIGDQIDKNNDLVIQANGNILDNTAGELVDLAVNNLTLNSTSGSVGLYSDSIDVSIRNNGVLNSNAWGFIGINAPVTSLPLDSITNAGRYDVRLSAPQGEIRVGNPAQVNNIISNGLELLSGGQIGDNINPLRINTDAMGLGGVVNAASGNSIFINETSGPLRVGTISNNGLGDATLQSAGGIVDASPWEQPNVFTRGLILNGFNGTIGTQAEDFDIFTNYNSAGGTLVATADADVVIFQYMGNLWAQQITSNFGVTQVASESSIIDGNPGAEIANITGSSIRLTCSLGGSLGLYNDSLDINLTAGNLNASANGYVWLSQDTGIGANNPLTIEQIANGGLFDTRIDAPSNILNGRVDTNPNIVTRGLYLNNTANGPLGTPGGTVGTDLVSFSVYTNSNGTVPPDGTLTVLSQGVINIRQDIGDLRVASVSNNGRADVTLASAGSIYDAKTWNEDPNVYGRLIILNAAGQNIGINGGDDFGVAVNYNGGIGGYLSAYAAQNINITQPSGNLQLRNAYALGTVTINTPGIGLGGSIFSSAIPGEMNIEQPNIINLNSVLSIGTVATPIQVRIQPGGQVNAVSPDTHVNQN